MSYEQMISSEPMVLVEFFATWCIHCQHMEPVVEQVTKSLEGKCKVVQLDVDKNQNTCDEQKISATPTFILYKDGKEVWRQAGEMPAEELLQAVQDNM